MHLTHLLFLTSLERELEMLMLQSQESVKMGSVLNFSFPTSPLFQPYKKPQVRKKSCGTRRVCVCGGMRWGTLSSHIQGHLLGVTFSCSPPWASRQSRF